jgi:DNA-binding HxlR family transcriptional regulator
MARKKPYDDGCAAAHAMEIIGERWALLIVRELVPGPLRFSDLRAALPGISSNILTTRLVDLEADHVIERRSLPHPAATTVYALSDWGTELKPLIMELGRWAVRSPKMAQGRQMSAASVTMSFETMFDPARAGDAELTLQLDLGGRPQVLRVAKGVLTVQSGTAEAPDLRIEGAPTALAEVVHGKLPVAEAQGLRLTGDPAILTRFASFFSLPDPVVVT